MGRRKEEFAKVEPRFIFTNQEFHLLSPEARHVYRTLWLKAADERSEVLPKCGDALYHLIALATGYGIPVIHTSVSEAANKTTLLQHNANAVYICGVKSKHRGLRFKATNKLLIEHGFAATEVEVEAEVEVEVEREVDKEADRIMAAADFLAIPAFEKLYFKFGITTGQQLQVAAVKAAPGGGQASYERLTARLHYDKEKTHLKNPLGAAIKALQRGWHPGKEGDEQWVRDRIKEHESNISIDTSAFEGVGEGGGGK